MVLPKRGAWFGAQAYASAQHIRSELVSQNVQTVATSVEQMNASIRESARSATEAASSASMAVDAAENTNVTVSQLGTSSAEIGKVVTVINSIAEQTATNQEIARGVEEANNGTSQDTGILETLAEAATVTKEGTANTQQPAGELSELATSLQTLVAKFRV